MSAASSVLPATAHLPAHFRTSYFEKSAAIRLRLAEFACVPRSEWFYETAYCLMTPQTKALHAQSVVTELKRRDFLHAPFDPVLILRNPVSYIRFHRTKADRLYHLQQQWFEVEQIIDEALSSNSRVGRDRLASRINGMGMKEASHVLRNIGCTGLAIIDRHLIRCLIECSVLGADVNITGRRRYREIEDLFDRFSKVVGIDMDELDLLFWSEIAGLILK